MRIRSRYKPPGYRGAQLVFVPLLAGLLASGGLAQSCSSSDEDGGQPATTSENSPPRLVNRSESIQLTPCQRSAAACFESGGLDSVLDNLDGLAIDPVTGRFCFSFQEGCRR